MVLKEESIECLSQTIEDVLAWKSTKRQTLSLQIAKFLKNKKKWDIQARRFIHWINHEGFNNDFL